MSNMWMLVMGEKRIRVKVPELHSGQLPVLRDSRRYNVLQCGRRFGKTTLGEHIACDGAIYGYPVGGFAPTYKTLSEQWRSISRTLQPLISEANKKEMQIQLKTRGRLDFWSLDDPDSGRGRKYKVVIIDEASIVRYLQVAWEHTIRPTLTDMKVTAWFLGTPKGRNYFHQLFIRGQHENSGDWKSWRLGSVNNPYLDEQEIETAKLDLPEKVFQQEYLGIPDDDAGNPFGYNAIRSCVGELSEGTPVAFGVDLAKSHDWTVVCGLDANGWVCHLERWQVDWSQTRDRLARILDGVPAFIDSTGVGDPIVEWLASRNNLVDGYKFTSSSKQQLMLSLANTIQHGSVVFPAGWLVDELESFQYEYYANGRVSYSAPSGLHDDGVCALALAIRAFQHKRQPVPDVRVFAGGSDVGSDDDRWNWQ